MYMFWRCCWAVSIEVNIFYRWMNSGRLGGRGGRRGGMDIGRKRRGQAGFMVTYSQHCLEVWENLNRCTGAWCMVLRTSPIEVVIWIPTTTPPPNYNNKTDIKQSWKLITIEL